MAANDDWVCFFCRVARRVDKETSIKHFCLECGEEMFCLGHKARVPRRSDLGAWRKLEERSRAHQTALEKERIERRRRCKESLEFQIEQFEKRDENKDRARLIRAMKKQLESLEKAP